MDKIETESDCSTNSDYSLEYAHSNLSSMSGLSGYEDEIGELKRLIKIDSVNDLTYNFQPSVVTSYKTTINSNIWDHTNALNKPQHIKTDRPHKNSQPELENYNKIDKLMKHNVFLETQLKKANERVSELLINMAEHKNLNEKESILKRQIIIMQKTNLESDIQIQAYKKEILHWQSALEECENAKTTLEKECLEVNQCNESRLNCITELKKKICELYSEMHVIKQDAVKLDNSVISLQNDLERVSKSEEWYKQQLHRCQLDKQNIVRENLDLKASFIAKNAELDSLQFELSEWKKLCDELKYSFEQESRKLEASKEILFQAEKNDNEEINKIYYESVISRLADEIATIKQTVHENNIDFEITNKEKCELLGQVTILQEKLKEKEILTQSLQNSVDKFSTELKILQEHRSNDKMQINSLKDEKIKLEVNIDALLKEKNITEITVNTVCDDLHKLIGKYRNLQQQLQDKDNCIAQLKKEKQEMCLNNNWQIYELRQMNNFVSEVSLNENDLLIMNIKKLQRFIASLQKNIDELDGNKVFNKNLLECHSKNTKKDVFTQVKADVSTCSKLLYDTYLQLLKLEKSSAEFGNGKDHFLNNNCDCINQVVKLLELVSVNLHDFTKNKNFVPVKYFSNNGLFIKNFNIQTLLEDITDHLEKISSERSKLQTKAQDLKHKINLIQKATLSRIGELENKCQLLSKNNEESYNMLKLISCRKSEVSEKSTASEDVKQLRAIIKANEIEMKEKQTRYEKNNRTLLRKVKEHMRARKETEKHCAYLQDLYNNLSDDYNMLKLRFGYQECNKNNLIPNGTCSKCSTAGESIKNLQKQLEAVSEDYENTLKERDVMIFEHKTKIQELTLTVDSLEKENKSSSLKAESLQRDLHSMKEKLQEAENRLEDVMKNWGKTQDELLEKIKECSEQFSCVDNLERSLQDVNEKNNFLLKEVENLSGSLREKGEELHNLQAKYDCLQGQWIEKENRCQNTIALLKTELQNYQQEVKAMSSDKHFLQRICNDLKFALHSSLNQNKVLKEHVDNLTMAKKEYSSLPDDFLNLLPRPTKYDDSYITKLLEQSSSPSHQLLTDIKSNLSLLKGELNVLHTKINEKNFTKNVITKD